MEYPKYDCGEEFGSFAFRIAMSRVTKWIRNMYFQKSYWFELRLKRLTGYRGIRVGEASHPGPSSGFSFEDLIEPIMKQIMDKIMPMLLEQIEKALSEKIKETINSKLPTTPNTKSPVGNLPGNKGWGKGNKEQSNGQGNKKTDNDDKNEKDQEKSKQQEEKNT